MSRAPFPGTSPASSPGGSAFLRGPAEQPLAAVVNRVPAGVVLQDKLLIPDGRLPGVRAEMEVLPIGGEGTLDLPEEERQRIKILLNSVRISGIALSVGAVLRAARAAGPLASLLSATPAWGHVDPLPVLGRDEEEEEDTDLTDEDQDRRGDEHRARRVLDERAAAAQ